MKKTTLLILLLTVPACGGLPAAAHASNPRNVDASSFGERVRLGPEWLFAPGDNPAWASPTYDDSAWRVLSSNKGLIDYGIRDIKYGWYRIHIHLRPGTDGLMVGLEGTSGSYEVYANGVRIGGNGDMAGMVLFNQTGLTAYFVPGQLLTPKGDLVLAIRFALNAVTGIRGSFGSAPIHNSSSVYLLTPDAALRDVSYVNAHNAAVPLILSFLSLLAGLIALALYGALRSQREYLAVAIYLLASSGFHASLVWANLLANTLSSDSFSSLCGAIFSAALVEFVRLVLGQPRSRWLFGLEVTLFAGVFARILADTIIGGGYFGFAVFFLPLLIVDILLPVLLVRAWLRGNREAHVLLPAMLLYGFAQYWNFLRYVAFFTHLTATLHPLPTFHLGSYDASLYSVGYFVFYITILLFLVLRTVGIARRHAEVNAELEAARTVQQVLIPEEIPAIPGFALESVYKPAGQVGGDFFQILPTLGGGVLVVIGDVSGKGMPAAMTVSLLVGTVRTLAHYTQSPGEILDAMNQRMLGRSQGGFTTCLVLRADTDGTVTFANAGHIPPYRNGEELACENNLPLGLAAEASYCEFIFQTSHDDRLTLVTDGVVEARSHSGELFGFERTAALASRTAEAIAQAAQAFGQEDDITVLCLAFAPVGVTHV